MGENVKTFKHHIGALLAMNENAVAHLFVKARRAGVLKVQPRGVNASLPSIGERKALLRFIVAERFPDFCRADVVYNSPHRWAAEGCTGQLLGGLCQRVEVSPMVVRSFMTFGGVSLSDCGMSEAR